MANEKRTVASQGDFGTSTEDCANSQLARPFPEPVRPPASAGDYAKLGGVVGHPPKGGDNYPGYEL